MDALTQKVREGGRIIDVAVVIAAGVNRDGHREILGPDVITTEDGAGWLAFRRGLVGRGLAGTFLVISDAHHGLVDAIASTLTGASWQRCRTHYMGTTQPDNADSIPVIRSTPPQLAAPRGGPRASRASFAVAVWLGTRPSLGYIVMNWTSVMVWLPLASIARTSTL